MGCPRQNAISSTASNWALNGILPPTESHISPMDTNPGMSWSTISPTSMIDQRLIFTEKCQQQQQNSAGQPQSESPKATATRLRSPSAIRSPVMVNENVPVGSADIVKCTGNNAKMIGPSCLSCLPHFSSLTTVVPTSNSGPPTLCEAQKALEVVMHYFENQPTRLNKPECALLRKLMERLDPASNRISMFPGEHTF